METLYPCNPILSKCMDVFLYDLKKERLVRCENITHNQRLQVTKLNVLCLAKILGWVRSVATNLKVRSVATERRTWFTC